MEGIVFKSPTNLPVYHGSGPVDAPRGIVVAGLDTWTPCHASTSPSPVVDSPSYKKKYYDRLNGLCWGT